MGSSGGGKTTVLSCIVGITKLNGGTASVFGAKPGAYLKDIGYMPQEAALYREFTLWETFLYFGTLYGVSESKVRLRVKFLSDLLRLPKVDQRIEALSGGQKRRVSLAVALLHSPKFLILDEPTVSIDPIVREEMWKYLVNLSKDQGTTILITTHYIQEAKNCNTVGFIRDGRLLVESSPSLLLSSYNVTSLDAVFLNLCQPNQPATPETQTNQSERKQVCKSFGHYNSLISESRLSGANYSETWKDTTLESAKRIKSLSYKNLVIITRNLLLLIFIGVGPVIDTYLLCQTYHDDPTRINFGVVNLEVPNTTLCQDTPTTIPGECDIDNLSCKYIKFLPPNAFHLHHFASENEAIDAVHKGTSWGYVTFPEDFSTSLYERLTSGSLLNNEDFDKSNIILRMDETKKLVSSTVKLNFVKGLEDFLKAVLQDCGYDERRAELSLQYKDNVFGIKDITITNFIAPGCTVAWLFFQPIFGPAIRFINEKKLNTYERSLVAGTKQWEIFLSYLITESVVLVIRSLLVYVNLVFVVGLEILGSHMLVILLCLLSGFTGVSLGLFLGFVCSEEFHAGLFAVSLFFPNFIISGVMWPLEGIPNVMRYVAVFMPGTNAGEAMRSLFGRGWEFSHSHVWLGVATLFGHIVLYLGLIMIFYKIKTKS